MRYSHLFGKTNKMAPADADSANARLLIQGGFIDQLAAGIYTYLPLGLRVLNKIKQVVREEMNALGAQEVLMPALHPKVLYETTDRWEKIDVMFKLDAAGGREYGLSSTAEEVITPLVKAHAKSYRDFPLALYQIQDKFRNEPRAKSGLLRGREFSMKDLYSFHLDEEDFLNFYEQAKEAYLAVYRRCGLDAIVAAASGGVFTDKYSHEFQVPTEAGEDTLFELGGEYVNKEVAVTHAPAIDHQDEQELPLEEKEGVGIIGVEPLAKFLSIPVEKTTKTLLFETETGEVVAAAVRGGYDVNEEKLRKVLGCKELGLASEETVKRITGAEVGYAGLLNLPDEVRIIMDDSTQGRVNFEMGANKTNYHSINVNFGRDLPEPERFYDIKIAKEGDIDPATGQVAKTIKTIEVGNIFPLECRFSDAVGMKIPGEGGALQDVIMGCYGIGPSRVMGSVVEVHHDDRGMIWPKAIAPALVHIVSLDSKDATMAERINQVAAGLHDDLGAVGIDVLWDERKGVSAGAKFADADLIGIPLRIVVSEKTLVEDAVEWKLRASDDMQLVKLDDIMEEIQAFAQEG